jgi:acyl transferase domain-containing protein
LYGISDEEAKLVDPQQRIVLDCVHMALEDGGMTRKDIDGTNTGVYIGNA